MLVGSGGFLGSVARFYISRYLQKTVLSTFPFGTFAVNILGCFLIGLIYGLSSREIIISPGARLFLMAGFCGGFTTFSTFAHENLLLIRDGHFLHFFIYSVASYSLGLFAVYLGNLIVKLF